MRDSIQNLVPYDAGMTHEQLEDNLGKKISCLSKENKELNSQLQKRDTKTGRFVKK